MFAGRSASSLPGSDDDYLRDMDAGLGPEEVHAAMASLGLDFSVEEAWSRYNRGRNNWAVWTGGNDRFWNEMVRPLLRGAGPPEDGLFPSRPALWTPESVGVSGAGQRALLLSARPSPTPTGTACGSTRRDPSCPPDPFADSGGLPRGRDRGPGRQ